MDQELGLTGFGPGLYHLYYFTSVSEKFHTIYTLCGFRLAMGVVKLWINDKTLKAVPYPKKLYKS